MTQEMLKHPKTLFKNLLYFLGHPIILKPYLGHPKYPLNITSKCYFEEKKHFLNTLKDVFWDTLPPPQPTKPHETYKVIIYIKVWSRLGASLREP